MNIALQKNSVSLTIFSSRESEQSESTLPPIDRWSVLLALADLSGLSEPPPPPKGRGWAKAAMVALGGGGQALCKVMNCFFLQTSVFLLIFVFYAFKQFFLLFFLLVLHCLLFFFAFGPPLPLLRRAGRRRRPLQPSPLPCPGLPRCLRPRWHSPGPRGVIPGPAVWRGRGVMGGSRFI